MRKRLPICWGGDTISSGGAPSPPPSLTGSVSIRKRRTRLQSEATLEASIAATLQKYEPSLATLTLDWVWTRSSRSTSVESGTKRRDLEICSRYLTASGTFVHFSST